MTSPLVATTKAVLVLENRFFVLVALIELTAEVEESAEIHWLRLRDEIRVIRSPLTMLSNPLE